MTIVPKLTFCTVVMNRLHHVRLTLPRNLAENDDPSVQFDVLDYNSTDGLSDYIRSSFPRELESGKLNYYRHEEARGFSHSHSRNLAFRLAEGSIVCNLDADNYAGEEFGKYVIELFRDKGRICLTGLNNRSRVADAMGKICVRKQDFDDVSGYDESFKGYGFEDFDIVNRLALNGIQAFTINQPRFLQAITHSNSARLINQDFYLQMHSLYIRHIDAATSTILFLLKNGLYQRTTVVNNFQRYDCADLVFQRPGHDDIQFDIDTKDSEAGEWECSGGILKLTSGGISKFVEVDHISSSTNKEEVTPVYHLISDKSLINDAAYSVAQISNRKRMTDNLANSNIRPNAFFGKGKVVKNFDKNSVIEIAKDEY